ncbi:hypothetical protein [Streptosporangium sp. CA-115845]|uniref:hypothetical protein n=1 Tax=Streptosporangium sp. CA-115845 TaxID=3240071 RepID=UPI003D937D61
MASGCGCFAESPPLPMGCAVCGHAPYAHGCPGQAADHEYAQPSGELMAERLDVRRRLGLGRTLPTFQPAYEVTVCSAAVVPAPCQAERERTQPPTRPAGRTDIRRPALPGTGRPHQPVETREDRAARLALARDPRPRRRALIAARTPEHPPQNTNRQPRHPHPAAPPAQRTPLPPDINPNPRKDVTPLIQRTLTALPDIPGRTYRTPRPGLTIAPGRGRSPDTPSSWRQHPHRQEVAA